MKIYHRRKRNGGPSGRQYCREIGDEVTALVARQELDIADRCGRKNFSTTFSPDAVLNCAAYTNVDGAETEKRGVRRQMRQVSRTLPRLPRGRFGICDGLDRLCFRRAKIAAFTPSGTLPSRDGVYATDEILRRDTRAEHLCPLDHRPFRDGSLAGAGRIS